MTEEKIATSWPEAIRILRRQHMLTQREMAEMIGCATSSVKVWEEGRHEPREYLAGALASAFDLDPESLPRPGKVN